MTARDFSSAELRLLLFSTYELGPASPRSHLDRTIGRFLNQQLDSVQLTPAGRPSEGYLPTLLEGIRGSGMPNDEHWKAAFLHHNKH